MKTLLFLGILLSTGLASADFSGKYQGTGREYDSDGLNVECSEASITIEHSPHKISLGALIFKCGENLGLWEPIEFSIEGNNLFFQNQKVGDISADMINAKIWDQKTGETEVIYIYIDSQGRVNLNRMWNDPSNRSWLTFEALVEKKCN